MLFIKSQFVIFKVFHHEELNRLKAYVNMNAHVWIVFYNLFIQSFLFMGINDRQVNLFASSLSQTIRLFSIIFTHGKTNLHQVPFVFGHTVIFVLNSIKVLLLLLEIL